MLMSEKPNPANQKTNKQKGEWFDGNGTSQAKVYHVSLGECIFGLF